MSYLIYTCCFFQETYVDIVSNLLNTLRNTGSSVDFLIYTTTEYKELIKQKCANLPNNLLFFEKNFYKTMNQARISKMDIFDYPDIEKYEKILYVDADSMFLKDPLPIFESIQEDLVHVVGEGTIMNEGEYWGRSLFLKEDSSYADREGLGGFALGFKNIQTIKKMFIKIKQSFYLDMYQNKLKFYDQPFLNFFLIQNKMCNTEILKPFIKSRPPVEDAIRDNVFIVHFAGCPGHGNIKLELFNEFRTKYNSIHKPATALVTALVPALVEVQATPNADTIQDIHRQLEDIKKKTADLELIIQSLAR